MLYIFADDGSPLICTDYCGHATYLPPEVLAHKPFLPKPADVWSLGICLIYLIFLAVPFEGFMSEDILEEQMTHSWKENIAAKLKDSPKPMKSDVEKIIETCLSLEPNKRTNICDLIKMWDAVASESLFDT